MVISEPFKSFNSATRILKTAAGEEFKLPEGQQEKSSFLWPRTRELLKTLAKNSATWIQVETLNPFLNLKIGPAEIENS